MKKSRIKIVVDTNWWISFVINQFKSRLTELLINPSIHFITSPELQREIFETLDAPRLNKFIRQDLASEFKTYFTQFTLRVEVTSSVSVCRDPKDDFLLALAQDAHADYLITGDADLLTLGQFGRTKIMKLSDFILELQRLTVE
ncbi:MAG: putative toxin-antitoxin system toxin component, PIN family [Saprospiraceae bacterium]|nr:putative toxin-antitoxin system toxin component, PIN family [Saprospiraceae bacterium]